MEKQSITLGGYHQQKAFQFESISALNSTEKDFPIVETNNTPPFHFFSFPQDNMIDEIKTNDLDYCPHPKLLQAETSQNKQIEEENSKNFPILSSEGRNRIV